MENVTDKPARSAATASWVVMLSLGGLLAWSYWPALQDMQERWYRDPQYSHGYLVPAFALVLLWLRRKMLRKEPLTWNIAGLYILAPAIALRLAGMYVAVSWLENISLLFCLAGIFLLAGGRPMLRWSWPSVSFLFFMVPLPYFFEVFLSAPLRRAATVASVYCLQTLGVPALAEGNWILVNNFRMEVAEACSGLGMLMTFFALVTAVAIVLRKPRSETIFVVASAIPIALAANIFRITLTGMLWYWTPSDHLRALTHEGAGWMMMPVALLLLWLGLIVYSRLFVEEEVPEPGLPSRPVLTRPLGV